MNLNRREFIQRAPVLAGAGLVAAKWGTLVTRAAEKQSRPATQPAPAAEPLLFQNAQLHNIDHLEPNPGAEGVRLNRMPKEVWAKLNAMGKTRAFAAAGAELRFNLVGPEARVFLRYVENRGGKAQGWPVLAELYQGGFLMRCVEFRETWTEIVIRKPSRLEKLSEEAGGRGSAGFDSALVRLALPYMPETQILRIEGDIAPPRAEQVPARSYLAYGSSITHGSYALRAGETYPAQVGRALDVNVFNLGLGAAAYLEPEMAQWIARRRDWDFASLELGVNLLRPISTEEFARRVQLFLHTIVTAHPRRPIFVIDIFTSGKELEADPKRAEFRRVVREAVGALKSEYVRHLDGRALFTRTTGLCFDLLHPSSDGFNEIADRLTAEMRPQLQSVLRS
ncbi:MAG: SGNH/GDSL hydrolase family protein [Verrucomicrobiota bacterium]